MLSDYVDSHPKMSFWAKLVWPPRSPDLSCIENIWPELQRYVVPDDSEIVSVQDAKDRILKKFETYPI